jgi:lysophospholipase L1-like esterase
VGPFFVSQPEEMFAIDRFHPSGAGYRRTAKAILPSVLAALGSADSLPFGHHPPAGQVSP